MNSEKSQSNLASGLPKFRLHQCGNEDRTIHPWISSDAVKFLPIYITERVCKGETIVEVFDNADGVQVRVFHKCMNHLDSPGTRQAQVCDIIPHNDAIMQRLAK